MKPRRGFAWVARDRDVARACLATNLALPGLGTLMAGRWIGLVQALVTLTAFALTLVGGVKFFIWFAAHRGQFDDPLSDPVENLRALWGAARWPLLGIALFALNWLWALASSWQILRASRPSGETARHNSDRPGTPPRLTMNDDLGSRR
ncbi:MAG: hypothetical protein N3I86_13845 [Verrucomicrobiae bacterium]|nr:hypothetical protein [Verrucomicrobiae bacterium]